MSDLIDRQAAIDAICTEGTRLERNGIVAMVEIKQFCVDTLERVPSAQPEWAEITGGTIELELPVDVSQVKRVIVKQKDSHWCGVYYLGGHEE